jgi:hypothetical protein
MSRAGVLEDFIWIFFLIIVFREAADSTGIPERFCSARWYEKRAHYGAVGTCRIVVTLARHNRRTRSTAEGYPEMHPDWRAMCTGLSPA